MWNNATYHEVKSFAVDRFPCHDGTGCGRVNETVAYVLQKSHVALDAHGIVGARVDLGLVVLDSECASQSVSDRNNRVWPNRAHT